MKAVIFRGIGQIRLEEVEMPHMNPDDFLVEVLCGGLCGTDIKAYKQGHRLYIPPCIPGHEFTGRIVAAGPEADASMVGKKVVVAPYIGCGHCALCTGGFEELCETRPRPCTDGALTQYLTVSSALAAGGMVVLDEAMDDAIMTLVEPFACVLNSMGKSRVCPGQNALVIGAGPMGLLHIEALKLLGARHIVVSEYNETRGAIAREMGATVINPGKTPDVKAEIRKALHGELLNQVFVCVGLPSVVEEGILLADKGSTVNVFGGLKSGSTITIDPNILHYNEVTLVGTFGFSSKNFADSAGYIAGGKVDLSRLITHEFTLESAAEAFSLGAKPTDDVVKIVIRMK